MTVQSDGYLTDQLIPYLGSKRRLTGLITQAITRTGCATGTFFDVFAGSGAVSRLAKTIGFRVVANDWEPYARPLLETWVGCSRPPTLERLGGLDRAIQTLNRLPGRTGYIARHYCPADDEHPDPSRERMFYTRQNGRRIDAMRERLQDWHGEGRLDPPGFATLLGPLIFQSAYVSNTSGVFKGWHHGWGGRTGTALYRIRSRLTLRRPVFFDNGQRNEVHCQDALSLAACVPCEIAYLDPPYNQHQYGANYHLLNTVTLWDRPAVAVNYGLQGRRDKSAIRTDWRTERRSPWCYGHSAKKAFTDLLAKLRARWILVSYSTDGIMGLEWMLEELSGQGRLEVVTRRYKRYRVSSQRPSPRPHTTEFVLVVDRSRRGRREDVRLIREAVVS